MSHRKKEYTGDIMSVRAVEDSIRATRKYTEGIWTRRKQHPIQGEDFPSKKFVKYYEVYPRVDLNEKRPLREAVEVAFDLLWHDTPCIDVIFTYDYRENKASVSVEDGASALKELVKDIPGFSNALSGLHNSSNGGRYER